MPELIDYFELRKILGCSERTARKYARDGVIPIIEKRERGKCYFNKTDALKFKNKRDYLKNLKVRGG